MTDVLRIKRRALGGAAGPPASLAVGELAFNEQDGGLYIGRSNGTIVQLNSGTGGGISDAPSDGKTYGRLNATWSQVLPITGGTLTGNLTVSLTGASLTLNKPASGSGVTLFGQTNSLNRWGVVLGTGSAESGGNAGSDFLIRRYDDTGNTIDVPLTIMRSTGQPVFTGNPLIQPNTGSASITLNPLASSGAAAYIIGYHANLPRWLVFLNNGGAESGSNSGSDFSITRYNDAGAGIDSPFSITRASGAVSIGGTLAINGSAANPAALLLLQKTASGQQNIIYGTTAGSIRWTAMLGNSAAESGGNVGSDFELDRYSDAGALIDTPLAISRSTGKVAINGAPVAPVLPKYLAGLTLANDPTYPTNAIDVDVGSACSDDNTTMMVLTASSFQKVLSGPWVQGSGGSGLDTGSPAAGTWYHVYLIMRVDTYVVDVLVSTSATAPTMPSGYSKKRRIGSFKTNASAQILLFTQYGDMFTWANTVGEVNGAGLPAGNNNPLALSGVPSGVRVVALVQATLYVPAAGPYMNIRPLDQTSAPLAGEQTLYGIGGNYPATEVQVRTNTAQQIGISTGGSGANNYYINTRGWIDYRGK
jgi:hypothetical protein